MKKFLLLCIVVILSTLVFSSCKKREPAEPQKWEYKQIVINTDEDYMGGYEDYLPRYIDNDKCQRRLNELGAEGWELVSVATILETEHPNFGDKKYVTGLQPNTRTLAMVYVFKRPKFETKDEPAAEAVDSVEVVEEGVEEVAE